jgi:intracellular proteinase inhibitor BsuPI
MVFRARIMARLALGFLCLATLAGYSKCVFVSGDGSGGGGGYGGGSGGDGSQSIQDGDFTTTLILRDSTGTATTSFVMGEPIRFDLEVRNTSGHPISITLPTAQEYDFYVLEPVAANFRWRWSEGMAFAQVATPLNFALNSSKSYSVVWNGVLGDGTQLPAGAYRARGVVDPTKFLYNPLLGNSLGSNIVNFTVR